MKTAEQIAGEFINKTHRGLRYTMRLDGKDAAPWVLQAIRAGQAEVYEEVANETHDADAATLYREKARELRADGIEFLELTEADRDFLRVYAKLQAEAFDRLYGHFRMRAP